MKIPEVTLCCWLGYKPNKNQKKTEIVCAESRAFFPSLYCTEQGTPPWRVLTLPPPQGAKSDQLFYIRYVYETYYFIIN